MSSRNSYKKFRACIVAWRKMVPTEKSLVVSFWKLFQISRQTRRIRKNRDHQKVLLMQGYLSKINLEFSYFSFNVNQLRKELRWLVRVGMFSQTSAR